MRCFPLDRQATLIRRCALAVLALVFACLGGTAYAAGSVEGRRAALVIGNASYGNLPSLPNAVNDAERIGDVLRAANFEVTVGENLTKVSLERTIREFLQTLSDGDIALFYYSGHAVQVAGENFIIPVDASLSSSYDLEVETYNIGSLLDYMRASSSLQILVLDACRDNPFRGQQYYLGDRKVDAADKGLASLTPRQGSLIVYSTAPNEVAYDGAGSISPFAGAFAEHVLSPNREVREILTTVRNEVIGKTGGRQVPWDVSSLTSQFYFVKQQQMLFLGQSMTEVRASQASNRIALNIQPPISSGDLKLTARFGKVPQSGILLLDDKTLRPDTPFDAARISDVVYVTDPGPKPVELIPYAIESDAGQTATGAVAIVFDAVAAPEPQVAMADDAKDATSAVKAVVVPVSLRMTPAVGTGFEPVPVLQLGDRPDAGWLRLEARDPSTQVAVGDRMLMLGDLVKAEDVAEMKVRPAIHAGAADAKVVLQPVAARSDAQPIVISVDARVNECDTLAAEPLDIQAVTEGVLPDAIRIDEALAACRQAVEDFPEVARFKFQLGRVLWAKGDFDGSVVMVQAAIDGGHVRAGQFMGRLYQLGSGVRLDPKKAIPLFEAAARKGDPYGQYSLGRALMDGKGTAVDLKRGLELLGKAMESGHTYALNQLGAEYLYGRRIPKDIERAHVLFETSAARGDVWGEVNLALLYRDGIGVGKDAKRAYDMLAQADSKLHPYAARLMALMDRQAGKDDATVLPLFRRAASRGDAWGAYHVGLIVAAQPALAATADEAVRMWGLSAGRDAGEPSVESRKRLAALPKAELASAIQQALVELGAKDIKVDGKLGAKARQAAVAVLGKAPDDPADLYAQLRRAQWVETMPRLDML
jgi:TPR repeat protein